MLCIYNIYKMGRGYVENKIVYTTNISEKDDPSIRHHKGADVAESEGERLVKGRLEEK